MTILIDPGDIKTVCRCWGKTFDKLTPPGIFQPALYHMIDVGNIACVFLQQDTSPRWQFVFNKTFGPSSGDLITWIPFVIALHDIGKISAEFQSISPEQKDRLVAEGFSFGHTNQLKHTDVSQVCIVSELDELQIPKAIRSLIRDVVGGHHGVFAAPGMIKKWKALLQRDEPQIWRDLRKKANDCLVREFGFNLPGEFAAPKNASAALMAITGFTILCDWLGSDERYFLPEPDLSLEQYCQVSRERALRAVKSAGLDQPVVSNSPETFEKLFPKITNIRPLQKAIDEIPASYLVNPCLVIIEAPTGEGKTEAALALAHRIALRKGTDELYYALPTTATSNQMYSRLQKFIFESLKLDIQVKLVHSQAFLVEDDLRIIPSRNGPEANPVSTMEWFSPKKRSLLTGFGIGTIDQAELGALNVRHNALRLAGLAGKVVILDEVHAYDTYMTTIIERLLAWLGALGTSVILLSATLPQNRRQSLLKAYAPAIKLPDDLSAYPGMTVISQQEIYHTQPAAAQPTRKINLSHLLFPDHNIDLQAKWLLTSIKDGGCVCWITNTVGRAQELFRAIDEAAPDNVHRLLIHSRFSVDDRQHLEQEIINLYGPQGNRPDRGIVIGTQVLEQSLDLDFDLMVTDLAPVDLLLQRAGRLHRHDRKRPEHLSVPRLWLYERRTNDGNLNLISDKSVYSEYLLLKSYEVLEKRDQILLPSDYRILIEAVYNAQSPEDNSPLIPAWKDYKKHQIQDADQAAKYIIPEPDPVDTFCPAMANISFEESETKAGWLVAKTRLGEQSVTVIPMEQHEDKAVCYGIQGEFSLSEAVNRDQQLIFLRHSLRFSHQAVIDALLKQEGAHHLIFEKSSLLNDVLPLWLKNGQTIIKTTQGAFKLVLDPKLGLLISKE